MSFLSNKKLTSIYRLMLILQVFSSADAFAEDLQETAEKIVQDSFAGILNQKKSAKTFLKALEVPQALKEGNACKATNTLLDTDPSSNTSTLLLCVTLSMKDASLKSYDRDLRKVGGRLVIRGLIDDSFLKTSKRLKDLGIEVDIDPTVFEAFKVDHVPTFIHIEGKRGAYGTIHDRMTGNVSVLYALEEFSREGDLDAAPLLNMVRGTS
ncbi:MAG: type-F conjugative transfer system pilin assembly protein TrbC [Alphaproteobacteria bacterium]|nr:type-F conjugative transfer system pilin assembly protein TrbC [Alphaproteobacteria bacterium]